MGYSTFTSSTQHATNYQYQIKTGDNELLLGPNDGKLTGVPELFLELSKRIGTNQQYRDLGIALGLYIWEIDRIRTDHIHSIQQSAFQMFLFWYRDQMLQGVDEAGSPLELEVNLRAIFKECCIAWPIT